MAATVGSLLNLHEERIEEIINKNVEIILPSLDPIWMDTLVTSQGVGPTDSFGRDFRILKVFQQGLTGVIDTGKPYADITLYGDQTSPLGAKLYTQSLSEVWPNALEGPNQRPYRLGVDMRSVMTNLLMTMGELQAEALPAFIGQIIAPKLTAFGRNISQNLCNFMYLNQNSFYQLCAISAYSGTLDDESVEGFEFTFEPDNEATDRFFVGMRVDVYNSTGTTRKNDTTSTAASQTHVTRIQCLVSMVDELTNTVKLVSTHDPDASSGSEGNPIWTTAVANGDIVVYANQNTRLGTISDTSEHTGIAGLNSWIKGGSGGDDNFLLGAERVTTDAIDVTIHPEFKSFTRNMGGEPLTEHMLRKILRAFHRAKNKYGQTIDCLIASDGAWLAYEATKIGREILDRTNRLSSIKTEGSDNGSEHGGITFQFDGRTYMSYTSTYVEDGAVYGVKKGMNNWKRYVPPDPKGAKSFGQVESFIPFRFVAGILTGTNTIQLPMYDTSGANNRPTEGVQLPGMFRMQLVPDQPAGLKLTNCQTDKLYSDN